MKKCHLYQKFGNSTCDALPLATGIALLSQRLHWTLPKLSTPKQCERWTDLMPLISWELWLAREIVCDNPLPWHKPANKLTPSRVAQSFAGVLLAIDTSD